MQNERKSSAKSSRRNIAAGERKKSENRAANRNLAVKHTKKAKTLKRVMSGAGILAAAGAVAKFLGLIYRLPLTAILGGEGMGLYQMVFPLYTLMLTAASGGLPVAVSRTVAINISEGKRKNAESTALAALVALSVIGGALAVLLFILAAPIAAAQGNEAASDCYKAISPSVFFVCPLAVLRGYYQGKENMLPSAITQIVEQTVKLAAGLALSYAFLQNGITAAAVGAASGVTISELAALLSVLIPFFVSRRKTAAKLGKKERLPLRTLLSPIIKTALPVTFGALALPLTQVIDSLTVVNILSFSISTAAATTAYGLISGVVMPLINVPTVLFCALSAALLPKVASSPPNTEKELSLSLKKGLSFAVLAAVFFGVFSRDILLLLYSGALLPNELKLSSELLKLCSPLIVFSAVIHCATAALQGAGKASVAAKNLAAACVLKIIVTVALLPIAGIYGAAIGTLCCYALTLILDVKSVKKRSMLKFDARYFVFFALLTASLIAIGVPLSLITLPTFIKLLLSGSALLLTFITLSLLFRATYSIKIDDKEKFDDANC